MGVTSETGAERPVYAEPLVGAAAVRELTGCTSEDTARRKAGVLHWRSFAFTIGCGAQGPNEGATTVIEHVTCTACLSAYTHNDYPAAPLPATADVENDGDRGPRRRTARERLIDAAQALPDEWVAAACWMLSRLPTLRTEVEALTLANAETVDRHAKSKPVTGWKETTSAEETALASTWRAVIDVCRLIDPRRDVRRGGAR